MIFINTQSCSTRDVAETIHELDAAEIKFTMINSYYGRAPVNYVGVDDPAIGEAAVHYLADKNHSRIAFLSGSEKLPTHIHLLQGMRHGMAAHGLSFVLRHAGSGSHSLERGLS